MNLVNTALCSCFGFLRPRPREMKMETQNIISHQEIDPLLSADEGLNDEQIKLLVQHQARCVRMHVLYVSLCRAGYRPPAAHAPTEIPTLMSGMDRWR